ncbi:MAG: thioesterase family protein [Bacilli bacterium]|jgi:acyl-CoA thioester hydrolase|uniref:Acyl-CoA thioesterase n=1 Tax=Ureibacillus suwonensis TaxID=313007 RepID=A0ABW0RGV3_9BACL|nr:acyl-CoA thioesterase [Bacilli bacterium]
MQNRKLVIQMELPIQAYDIDAMGIVSNLVYVRWFEDLRMEFLNATYSLTEMMKSNITPILMRTEVDYRKPLTIFDKPIGRCWLVESGNSSWEMAFEIKSGDKLYCKGIQKGCFFDLEKKKVTRIPQQLISAIDRLIEP